MERVRSIRERAEHVGYIRVVHRLTRIVRNQVLLGYISDVIALIVFGEQMVVRLFLARTAVFGNGLIPFFGIGELRVNVKDDTAERVFLMTDNLSQMIFCACT